MLTEVSAISEALKNAVIGEFSVSPLFRRILFIRADEAPINRIQDRARAQVLMKLLNHPDSEHAIAELSEWAFQDEKGTKASFEVNPASLA